MAVAGQGPRTLLALHGYPDTLHVFARLAAHLQGARLIAADFPGQGRSDVDVDVVTPADRARWLLKLLDALATDRVAVFGHDMGAMTALELALLAPDRVERVVTSNALLSSSAPTSSTVTLLRASRAYRFLLPTFPRSAVARCLTTFLPPDAPLSLVVRDDVERAFEDPAVTSTTVMVCDAAEDWLRRGLARFAALPMPVVALWSSAGGHFPRAHANDLRAAMTQSCSPAGPANCSVVDVDGGRHWLVWHDPVRVRSAALPHR